MQIKPMDNSQWPAIQEIYKEAFPKSEQKPFFLLKRPVRSGKAQLWTAEEDGQLLGFLLADIWKDLVLVDYLAVSSKSRGKGTGSQLLHPCNGAIHRQTCPAADRASGRQGRK